MKLLHLTPKTNLNSIQRVGILPTKIRNRFHEYVFNRDGLEGNKCIYLWSPDESCETKKVIDDFIYCKNFIHPRNDIITYHESIEEDSYYDFRLLGKTLYDQDRDYVLLEVNSENIDLFPLPYIHGQTSEGDYTYSSICMDPKYEHDDKSLRITDNIIPPSEIKVVAEVSSRVYKNDTLGITYKKIHKNGQG